MRETYFTGKPCKNGHVAARLVINRTCVECYRSYIRKGCKKWRQTEKGKNTLRIHRRQWQKNNPAKVNAACLRRTLAKINRTPSWADNSKIEEFYHIAQQTTKETGIQHVVDHVIPLRGKTVSGLHVEYNLQVIPAIRNAIKGNSYES